MKRVVVIASENTERQAIPHLVAYLRNESILVHEVRILPRNGRLDLRAAEKLIEGAWYENFDLPIDEFVILLDVDRKKLDEVLAPFERQLPDRLRDIPAAVVCAFAQWHLEAWYFADSRNLRSHLGRDLGRVDTSKPDEIRNPKRHLMHLIHDPLYTSRVAERIAGALDPEMIANRSPSFKNFLNSIRNGKD